MPKQKQRSTWKVKKIHEPVRLSQCMIVKNEEKNIERALNWAKGIAFEQIVVDTGSTDRTVEIAKRMGATVFHFKWINDFAAAKNFAIEKARGNWIAFLDADEYFIGDNIKLMLEIVKRVQAGEAEKDVDFIRCSWAHLNDEGKPFMVNIQDRIFRNDPSIRYHGSIHEQIAREGGSLTCLDASKDLTIYHTGYMQTTLRETNKANRNVELLRKALEDNPSDINLYGYLGESLFVANEYQEAEQMFLKLLENEDKASFQRRVHAYSYLARIMNLRGASAYEIEAHYERALLSIPDHYDYLYGLASTLRGRKSYFRALEYYDKCEEVLKTATNANESYAITRPAAMYWEAFNTANEIEDISACVKYAILFLRQEKFNQFALYTCLKHFYPKEGNSADDASVFGLLNQIYDLTKLKDKLFALKCVRSIDNDNLSQMVLDTFTAEEMEWLNEKDSEQIDPNFASSMYEVARSSEAAIAASMRERYDKLALEDKGLMVEGMAKFGYWGQLNPLEGDYTAFENASRAIKERYADFIWLHRRLEDARSKNVLFAVIMNWLMFDFRRLMLVRDKNYPDYFDQEVVFCSKDEVFVDVGAFNGDTSYSYIKTYGEYARIYCYEPTPELYEELCGYMGKYENMELRSAAVGEFEAPRFLKRDGSDGALNRVVEEETDTPVEMVSLDNDITEPVTFIKLDVEGMEKEVLRGARRHITEEKPKLAISVYHNHTDVVEIARMVTQMNPNYKLYLRYYGGNLMATEFVLLAIDGAPEKIDWRFNELKKRINEAERDTMIDWMKRGYDKLSDEDRASVKETVSKNTAWGAFDPENGDCTMLENRANFFMAHKEGIEWLYDTLNDARSKNVLFAILSNYLDMDIKLISDSKEAYHPRFFDSELIRGTGDDVFVDLVAKEGDATLNFLVTYGNYKKVYCYGDNEREVKDLEAKLASFKNIEFMQRSYEPIEQEPCDEAAANAENDTGEQAAPEQKQSTPVTINLDEEISEPVSFIKLDLAEENAATLRLAARHIREDMPALAIALGNSYEDIIKLPKLVLELNPGYSLYMRIYEGGLIADKFVLYAKNSL